MQQRLIAIILFVSLPAHADLVYDRIVKSMSPHSITIIGETHKRPESIHFFQSLIAHYLSRNTCLTIALEIASEQQSQIDGIAQEVFDVANLDIAPMIDHVAFRTMINDYAQLQKNNECLKMVAVDSDLIPGINRDKWLAEKLAEQIGEVPVIALLGSLHTLKKINWKFENKKVYVAGILASQGFDVKSFPQIWTDKECKSRTRFIPADEQVATEVLNSRLISVLNAHAAEKAVDVVDGIILWECGLQ